MENWIAIWISLLQMSNLRFGKIEQNFSYSNAQLWPNVLSLRGLTEIVVNIELEPKGTEIVEKTVHC